jgi:hypothetical protein
VKGVCEHVSYSFHSGRPSLSRTCALSLTLGLPKKLGFWWSWDKGSSPPLILVTLDWDKEYLRLWCYKTKILRIYICIFLHEFTL